MSDDKAAAAYHPGDAHVTRPDLDALIARLREWADHQDVPAPASNAIDEAVDALAAERARADQATADLAAVEERVTDALLMGTRLDSVKADVMRALQPYVAPTTEQ